MIKTNKCMRIIFLDFFILIILIFSFWCLINGFCSVIEADFPLSFFTLHSERKEVSENHTITETCADRICRMLHCSPLPASFMWILLRRSLLCSLCDTYNPSTLSLSRARTRRLYPQRHVDTALQLQSKKQQTGPVITSRVLQSAKWYTHIHTLALAQEHIQKHLLTFLPTVPDFLWKCFSLAFIITTTVSI